jgi:hypothetical protein
MRVLFGIMALLGLAGMVFGVLAIIRGSQLAPFSYENYGGPGSIIGGVLLMSVSIYLFLNWSRFESSSRGAPHQ